MRERICLRHVLLICAVDRLTLLGKNDGNVIQMAEHRGDGDATGLDCQHLVHLYAFETAFQLVSNLTDNADVDLMIQEAIDLQDVSRKDLSVACSIKRKPKLKA